MTKTKRIRSFYGHKTFLMTVLCLFGLCLLSQPASAQRRGKGKAQEQRVYLDHADELYYDEFARPGVQIAKGRVQFHHNGARLFCDSAYFQQESNTFDAFGHVRLLQGDTLSLTSNYAYYDGNEEMVRARRNVVLRHRKSVLYTDSLDYDRAYNFGYFFEGGKIVDGNNNIVSDWGEYNTETREAIFYYNVVLKSPKYTINTDTLHYDTRKSMAHVMGPSTILSDGNTIHTSQGFYDTKQDRTELFGRSTIENKQKSITADTLYNNSKTGVSEGFGNMIYIDKENKNELHAGYGYYNEKDGTGVAARRPVAIDYSQGDTLWVHADSIRMKTFHIDTDSAYREVYGYYKVRAYRKDVQGVCDSLVINSKDSCMTMYRDPIAWYGERQLLGEVIKVYSQDSTIRFAHVIGQASSIEKMEDNEHYNQVASKDMKAYFTDGKIRMSEAIGNVQTVYYPIDEKDSSIVVLNYLEGDTMRMFFDETRRLQRIWVSKPKATAYPLTQAPPEKHWLPNFTWFDYIRPLDKDDIFIWRGKEKGTEIKAQKRRVAPLQQIGVSAGKVDAPQTEGGGTP